MQLPKNAESIVNAFTDLTEDRKNQIVEHLKATPEKTGSKTIATLIANGGHEGRLVAMIFGKVGTEKPNAPQNKAISPIHTK